MSDPVRASVNGPAPMGRVAWFHCFAGIAGDMALGGLVDAGADATEVTALLRRLPIAGWHLRFERVLRGGISCTKAVVEVADDDPVRRTHRDLVEIVRAAALPGRVEARALGVFAALASCEAAIHAVDQEAVHFHEVGGHDALVDIVGTAAALEVLGIDQVTASSVAVGTGTVRAAHGALPNPPPAVLRLLQGVPTHGRPLGVELTTPTGAAIVSTLASSFGPMPAMEVLASGYGAGTAELDTLPNCTQVVVGVGALEGGAGRVGPGQPVTVLEANLDDATGEQLSSALAALMEAGALDAWITPVVMKKGRPGHTVHVLADPARGEMLASVLRSATGSFGVRALRGERWAEKRRTGTVDVGGQPVRVKEGLERVKAEHDDVLRAAAALGLYPREVATRAERAWGSADGETATDEREANPDS